MTLLLGDAMSREQILKQLETFIDQWKQDPSDENWKYIEAACSLVMAKSLVSEGGYEKVSQRMDNIDKVRELIKNDPLNGKMS